MTCHSKQESVHIYLSAASAQSKKYDKGKVNVTYEVSFSVDRSVFQDICQKDDITIYDIVKLIDNNAEAHKNISEPF